MPAFFSYRTEKKDDKIYCFLHFFAFIYRFFKVCTGNFEQYDVNDCFMHENVHADFAIWTNVFENDTGQ